MSKAVDYISATLLIFLLTFVWTCLAFKNLTASLIATSAFTVIAQMSIMRVSKTFQKPYTYDRLEFEFCLQGNEYVINLIKSVIKNAKIESGCNYILLDNEMIVSNFKFSSLNMNDVNSIVNLAKTHNKTAVFVLAKAIDRHAYQIAQTRNIKIALVKTKEIFKFLKKHNALPDLKQIKKKFSLRNLIATILSRSNFKGYAFSGCVLILTSFLTPLKIYYLTFGTISLMLALLSLTPLGNGSVLAPKAFCKLEELLEKESIINREDESEKQ